MALLARIGAALGFKAQYDAARAKRRLANWRASTASARAMLAADGGMMRARARDVVRNNPYAASAADSFKSNVIGTGIKPSSKITDSDARKAIQQTWLDWTDEADADGVRDFYGLQEQVALALFEAGECFVRFRQRQPGDMETVPLQLQLLESDMLDLGLTKDAENGNQIVSGVEFDLIGRRVAYHFFREHPGDGVTAKRNWDAAERVRVPASEVLHVANLRRPGQVRGVPIVAPSIVKLWLLDQYDDAELDRKKTAAMYAGFITSPDPGDFVDPDDVQDDADGAVSLEPGLMQFLKPGESVTFSTPAEVGGSYEAFQYRTLLAAFSGLGVPYSFGTGDLKRANYSSLRGAIVEYRRRIEQVQHNIIVFQLCRPVWRRWFADGVLSGAIEAPGFSADPVAAMRVKWVTPRFDWVDPLKDVNAEIAAVNAGFKSRSDVIEAQGEDPEDVDDRIAADRAREAILGLSFNAVASPVPPDPPPDQSGDQIDNTDAAAAA